MDAQVDPSLHRTDIQVAGFSMHGTKQKGQPAVTKISLCMCAV